MIMNIFVGDTINGIKITKSGMIAASHLGGAGVVAKISQLQWNN